MRSDTPRSDAIDRNVNDALNLCRKLERELSNMRHCAGSCECAARMLEEANEALRAENERLKRQLDPEATHL